jgi:extracellular elastinolytic metalloproteinase
MAQTSARTTDFAVAPYVSNNPRGLQRFPYSVNTNTNPLTYASLQQLNEVHGTYHLALS